MLAEGHNVPVKHMYNDNGNASLHKLPADCVQRQPYLPIQYLPHPPKIKVMMMAILLTRLHIALDSLIKKKSPNVLTSSQIISCRKIQEKDNTLYNNKR